MKENISKNFTLSELLATDTGIENKIESLEHYNNLVLLVNNIVQPIRDEFGRIKVNSGYRCKAVNLAVGGVESSQHRVGQAIDIKPLDTSLWDVFNWVSVNCYYDQLILYPTFIHISYKSKKTNRNQKIVK